MQDNKFRSMCTTGNILEETASFDSNMKKSFLPNESNRLIQEFVEGALPHHVNKNRRAFKHGQSITSHTISAQNT